jgi:hypothetical protein
VVLSIDGADHSQKGWDGEAGTAVSSETDGLEKQPGVPGQWSPPIETCNSHVSDAPLQLGTGAGLLLLLCQRMTRLPSFLPKSFQHKQFPLRSIAESFATPSIIKHSVFVVWLF